MPTWWWRQAGMDPPQRGPVNPITLGRTSLTGATR
jgi:hypothetical protein